MANVLGDINRLPCTLAFRGGPLDGNQLTDVADAPPIIKLCYEDRIVAYAMRNIEIFHGTVKHRYELRITKPVAGQQEPPHA